MSESDNFLKFLFNEPIYVINEGTTEKVNEKSEVNLDTKTSDTELKSQPVHEPTTVENEVVAKKNEILILFDNPSDEHIEPSELEYLKKILGAINRSVDNIDFLNVAYHTPEAEGYPHIIAFTPNHKLSIDKATLQYTQVSFSTSQLIVADALKNISASTELRKRLWDVLKKVFVDS